MCQIALVMICVICIRNGIGKEKSSVCEQNWCEGERVLVQGKVYAKTVADDQVTLFLKQLRLVGAQEKVRTEEFLSVSLTKEEEGFIPEIGTQVLVEGVVKTIQEPTNPGNFNQRVYYQKQNIYCMLQKGEILQTGGSPSVIREKMWQIRRDLSERIVAQMGERYGGILCTMLFCEDAYEVDEVKEILQKSGLGHLLAVSSLHMMFWGMGLYRILKRVHIHNYVAVLLNTLGLGVYMFFIGGSVSALRAFRMFVIRMIGVLLGREYDGLSALSLSAILQLSLQPLYLYDAGFLLSYGAVLGIYLIGDALSEDEYAGKDTEQENWFRKHFSKEALGEKLRIPFAVQAMILPIMLYFYYEICVYSFAWNLVAVPLASLVMSLGAAGMLFPPLLNVAKGVLWFWEMGSTWILKLPCSRWVTGQPQIWQILIYYAGLGAILLLIQKNQECSQQSAVRGRTESGIIHFGRTVLVFGFVLGILFLTVPQRLDRSLEVSMIDVGQGDGFFVKSPSGETMLVDGGSSSVSSVGRYKMEPFLKYRGVGVLDYVFLSHGDEDHTSGIQELIERQLLGVKIRRLVLPPQRLWDENLTEIALLAESQNIPIYTIEQGEKLQVGQMQIRCLWPSLEVTESGNEASMVLSLSCGEFDILFTGDLESGAEEQLCQYMKRLQESGQLPETYEVLKVGHHGSKNATGETLLEVCSPLCALISAGEGNSYGHPSTETLTRLEEAGCKIYCTIECGLVCVRYKKGKMLVWKCRNFQERN